MIHQATSPDYGEGEISHRVVASTLAPVRGSTTDLVSNLATIPDIKINFSDADSTVTVDCAHAELSAVIQGLTSGGIGDVRVIKLEKQPLPRQGEGRIKTLETPMLLKEVVEGVKKHVGVKGLRLATARGACMGMRMTYVAVKSWKL